MLSPICFNLDHSNILLSGNGLNEKKFLFFFSKCLQNWLTPAQEKYGVYFKMTWLHLTFALSIGSIGESASNKTLAVFIQPLAAAQSSGVHKLTFLETKLKKDEGFQYGQV